MFKLDGYCNKITEVAKAPTPRAGFPPRDEFFDSEYEAMQRMFNRSADEMDNRETALKQAELRHKRLFKKFGARLRELRLEIEARGTTQKE